MIELTSPIRTNTTLKDLGLPVDYFYPANNLLVVENNATLTIEPGVTIQFDPTGDGTWAGIRVRDGATVKAIGTATKRIGFIGKNFKGSWRAFYLDDVTTDNRFEYCDFVNIGDGNSALSNLGFLVAGSKAGFSYCTWSGGKSHGLYISGISEITAFNNNLFEDFDYAPVHTTGDKSIKVLEKFDMTSDFTKNKEQYISVGAAHIYENVTLNRTTVPYYIGTGGGAFTINLNHVWTINEGVTIYMGDGTGIRGADGRLMVNGTASQKVRFTRYPHTDPYHWHEIRFGLPGSVIKHCSFEYGGGWTGMPSNGTLRFYYDADLTLENVDVTNSNTHGICLEHWDSKIRHSGVTLSGNKSGNVYRNYNPVGVLPELP
jgi:hypothetical protein